MSTSTATTSIKHKKFHHLVVVNLVNVVVVVNNMLSSMFIIIVIMNWCRCGWGSQAIDVKVVDSRSSNLTISSPTSNITSTSTLMGLVKSERGGHLVGTIDKIFIIDLSGLRRKKDFAFSESRCTLREVRGSKGDQRWGDEEFKLPSLGFPVEFFELFIHFDISTLTDRLFCFSFAQMTDWWNDRYLPTRRKESNERERLTHVEIKHFILHALLEEGEGSSNIRFSNEIFLPAFLFRRSLH